MFLVYGRQIHFQQSFMVNITGSLLSHYSSLEVIL